jgi:hypothetical protein
MPSARRTPGVEHDQAGLLHCLVAKPDAREGRVQCRGPGVERVERPVA